MKKKHVKLISRILLGILVLWFIIGIIVCIFQTTVKASESISIYPPKGLGSQHTYTIWDRINWSYKPKDLINYVIKNGDLSNNHGIVTYGEYLAGATTSTYGSIGDMLLVVQEDDFIYPVIIADIKNQNDVNCTKWGHRNGNCIIEFEILNNSTYNLYKGSGYYISPVINKPIKQVINIGSVFKYNFYIEPKQAIIDNGFKNFNYVTTPYDWINYVNQY